MDEFKTGVPGDFFQALRADKTAHDFYTSLTPSHQSEYVKWIEEAKKPEIRATRIQKSIEMIRQKRLQDTGA